MAAVLRRAQEIADEVLFPAALEVDETGRIPDSHFELLAKEGFYGLAAPRELGGPGVELPEIIDVLEALAGGCLATMFTWMQHNGAVLGLAASRNTALTEQFLAPAISGELRLGVAFAGAIPPKPRLTAKRVNGGYRIDGEAPFVSGWGIVGRLQISARTGDELDRVVNGLIEAAPADGLRATELRLVAAQGASTVRLDFDGYFLPDELVTAEITYAEMLAGQAIGSRLNGCVAVGGARRSIRLLEEAGQLEPAAALLDQLTATNARLDEGLADPDALYQGRAMASEIAYRAAGALVAAVGSSSVLLGSHAQRLAREAVFTLVAASRPQVKGELLGLFTA